MTGTLSIESGVELEPHCHGAILCAGDCPRPACTHPHRMLSDAIDNGFSL